MTGLMALLVIGTTVAGCVFTFITIVDECEHLSRTANGMIACVLDIAAVIQLIYFKVFWTGLCYITTITIIFVIIYKLTVRR